MWNSKIFDQWRSYLSLKTSVLVIFLLAWNIGFLIAMYAFGNGFGLPITPKAGIAISIVCICACIFCLAVSCFPNIRSKLLEPTRAKDYRSQDFYLLSFVTFVLSIAMLFFPRLANV